MLGAKVNKSRINRSIRRKAIEDCEDNKKHGQIRPGGRTEAVRQAVAEAVLALLQAGNSDFSMAEVATRAGIHRSTLYRRWPTQGDLIREAMGLHAARIKIPNTGSWEQDLRLLIQSLAEFAADPVEQAIMRAMIQPENRLLAEQIIAEWTPVLTMQSSPIQRALQRGDIDPDIDPVMIVSLLLSPLLLHCLVMGEAVPDSFQAQLAAVVLKLTACN